jgi:hypothetical protein
VDVVVAYNSPFEKKCMEAVAAAAPEHAGEILAMASKLRDLLPVVRDHVYHPDFLGSFNLKAVVPALIPDLDHEGLDVSKGHTASALLYRLLFLGEPQDLAQREAMRRSLLDYCAMDTLALVRLKDLLDVLAATKPGDAR